MPIRNPFKRGPGGLEPTEAILPELADSGSTGFQKTNVVGAKPIDIKEPLEYKLSGKRKSISERLRSMLAVAQCSHRVNTKRLYRNQRQWYLLTGETTLLWSTHRAYPVWQSPEYKLTSEI